MGSDRSRRGAAYQELGGQDQRRNQESAVPLRAGPLRDAARESHRRPALDRRVRRRPAVAADVSLPQHASHRGRKRQAARLQEPRRTAQATCTDLAAAHACRCARRSTAADDRDRTSPADRRAVLDARRTAQDHQLDRQQGLHQRDGLAATAQGAATGTHDGGQHLLGRQRSAWIFEQVGAARYAARRIVSGVRSQDRLVLRVDVDARSDRGPRARPR